MEEKENIKKKTEELVEKIKTTEGELKLLRDNCGHSEYKIKNKSAGEGTVQLRRVCDFCDEIIGYPSAQELKDGGYDK